MEMCLSNHRIHKSTNTYVQLAEFLMANQQKGTKEGLYSKVPNKRTGWKILKN